MITSYHTFATARTRHAVRHQQQLAIPTAVIDALLDFGECRPAGGGADSVYFTKRSWRRLSAYVGSAIKGFERYRHCYLIVGSDGAVITAEFQH